MIIVLTVAGLVENKGYFTLLKAAQKIVPNEPNIKFITVGECPLRPKMFCPFFRNMDFLFCQC